MGTFRDDFGAALEKVARLEAENAMLRAELHALEHASGKTKARPRPISKRLVNAAWVGMFLVVCIGPVLVNLHLASTPIPLDASAHGTATSTNGAQDLMLGCTTPFVYIIDGEPRPACLMMPP
jgi:hypothetical protein